MDGILENKQGNIPISELSLAPSIYALPLYPSLNLSFSLIIIMAMVIDQRQAEQQQQQQAYKHYCRICKKGFGCGRALGGHMRAHGLIDDAAGTSADADDTSGYGEWDHEKLSGGGGTKRMYALRTNSNRLKSCRVCENCGKEFISWKSFLEHGKCISDDEAGDDDDDDSSFPSSPRSYDDDLVGWSKGKRSRRTKVAMSEEEDLANCLVMLSSARVDPASVIIETEESCASACKEDDRRKNTVNAIATGVEAAAATTSKALAPSFALPAPPAVPKGLFECKACKKVFTSHQALGGHRASHKKVKGCFAAKLSALDEMPSPPADEEIIITTHNKNNGSSSDQMAVASMSMALVPIENPAPLAVAPVAKKKSKVHECSICHRVFMSGQALGGHKRCHWITSNSPSDPTLKLQPLPGHAGLHQQLTLRPMFDANSNSEHFDLNMPPIDDAVRRDIGSSLRLEIPAAIYLRSWINDRDNASKNRDSITTSSDMKNNNNDQNRTTTNNIHNKDNITCNEISSFNHIEDEVDSKVKLAKLSELKDINMGEESSDWLQVGIGSSANEGSEA